MTQPTMESNVVRLGKTLSSENYADCAEKLVKAYMDKTEARDRVTTSKLRGIYAYVTNVYTRVNDEADFQRNKGDIQYLKVRMAYEAGREGSVKAFLDATSLRGLLNVVTTYEQFMLFCRYAESLVAYFKFFGGKDQ